jgi:hypothetical protein
MVAAVLADHEVAEVDGRFDQAGFETWLQSHQRGDNALAQRLVPDPQIARDLRHRPIRT